MHPYLNIAIRAARQAGSIITRHLERLDTLSVFEKGLNDLVTQVDKAAEAAIIDIIHKAYPTHGILGEESGLHPGDAFTWVIDPLDGTLNYVHGFPQFAVSIAIKQKNHIEHGVIYDPVSQDLYTATRGTGAYLNNRRIRVSERNSLNGALIGTAFSYQDWQKPHSVPYFNILQTVFKKGADIRRIGCASLNLAYTAAGKLDGFWEADLKEWDIAAGVLMVREAGGFISDFKAGNDFLKNGDIIAGPRKIYAELLELIQAPL